MIMSGADVVKQVYAAFADGDMDTVVGLMQPDIRWMEAENFPTAATNPHVGPAAIMEGVFAWLGGAWEGFAAKPSVFIDGNQTVVALGRYGGRFIETGKTLDAQFAHIWTLKNDKIASFQQYTDTLQALRVTQADNQDG